MKKKLIFFFPLLSLLIICVAAFGACSSPIRETTAGYTVRFHDNYQGDYAKVEVEAGKTVSVPAANPTRTGYVFKGWFTGYKDDAAAFNASTPIQKNITVYARWERNAALSLVTLKYLDYKTSDDVKAVNKGSPFAEPADPVYDKNEMYEFNGWYTDEACTLPYLFTANVNSDITLYAGWTQTKVYVKFDFNYAACPAPNSKIAELGKALENIEAATRPQFAFLGWYTSRVGGLRFNDETPVTEGITVYAQWARNAFDIVFDVNGATLEPGIAKKHSVEGDATLIAEFIQNSMTYPGHSFAGWYIEKYDPDAVELSNPSNLVELTQIRKGIYLYAGWTINEYQVSFDLNYEGAPEVDSKTVKYNQKIEAPTVDDRDDYIFIGWFSDDTLENQFVFKDMTVTGDLTLYAKWMEKNIENPEFVTITYFYNIGSGFVQFAQKTIAFNDTANSDRPDVPTVPNYKFADWYKEQGYTNKFAMGGNVTADTNVYAKMLKKYTFEAEATDLTGKPGQGTSTNGVAEQLIMDYTYIKDGDPSNVSNGYFVRMLYYNGAFLDFEIEAAEEIFDAILYLRVSSESYQFFTHDDKYNYLSDQEFKIVINGDFTGLNYGQLKMPKANIDEPQDLDGNKTPFEDCFIISNLHLRAGRNVITLYVDNVNAQGGTFDAEAPIIDCMYIYAATELTMTDYEFYLKDDVVRG